MAGLLTEKLVKEPAFYYKKEKKDEMFFPALMEELCFHYDHNALYRSFCDNKGFHPHTFHGSIEEIPPVQVSVFKELGGRLNSVEKENIRLTLQSSATSGIPSSILVDAVTAKRQAKAMVRVVGDYIGNERRPFLIMDVDPAAGFRHILGARYAAVSGYLNFASEAGYFLKVDNSHYYFDTDGIQAYVKKLKGQSAVVFGFTYILYSEVLKPLSERKFRIKLPEGSRIIHIGGWKKLESEKVSKEEFNRLAANVFGVVPQDVIDIYGFTEQMGLNYPDCPCGCKHTPFYSEVAVRDVVTKEVLPAGKEGLLEFVSPIPHSYPGNVILTDDIGVIVDGDCEYHRGGRRFRVLGRLKKAEVRGCGDILSDKLKSAEQKTVFDAAEGAFGLYYRGFDGECLKGTAADSIQIVGTALRSHLEWLRKQPIDALIGLIAKVSEKWDDASLSDTQSQGLKFLLAWCRGEHLAKIADDGLRGNRMCADRFVPSDDNGVRAIHAVSLGLVCHWLAGNVQVLGMFVLIQSILAGNVNLIRVSSRDNGVFVRLLRAFEGEAYTTPGGYRILGDDLLACVAVVSFDHSDQGAGAAMSGLADARIAWGGAEAVAAVAAYPCRYDCTDIIMGPKLSFSAVSSEALSDERSAAKLARRIAVDASVFDQTGCASAHNVFVEKGGNVKPEEFAKLLSAAMAKVAVQIPKGPMTPEMSAAVHSARGIYDFKGTVYGDPESVWTVLYSEDEELSSPVYSRVVFVHPMEHLNDAVRFVSEDIQTIGLAAVGEKAMEFAVRAARKGAVRFPVCGRMLNFESPWDGMFVMERLVRFVTLGGPVV